ncbi:MAG: hypothetical protein WC250_01305 [Candidatus Paceibacterota bacterium]|jgi:nicotinic acid mononucleotide adenylyltransferase
MNNQTLLSYTPKDDDFGVYVGRLNPMHLGHQAMVSSLLQTFGPNHLLLIGSCNKPISIRHLFNYADRCDIVRAVFPEVRIAPLPDFDGSDALWFRALDDILWLTGIDPTKVLYIGGSREDVEFYRLFGRKVEIVNRFGGLTVNVSGSEIRDALIEHRPLEAMLDPRVIPIIQERFAIRWEEVKSR